MPSWCGNANMRTILAAAWPQAAVVLCRNLVQLTDVAVLGWLGTDELAAVAFAQIVINLSSVMLFQGFGDALITLASQAIGARNPKLAGIWLQTSLVFISVLAIPIAVLWWYGGAVLGLAGELIGPKIRDLATVFTRWSIIWLLPDSLYCAFSQWLNAQQKVKPTLLINVVFVFWNIGANVFLVHGAFGWNGLGFIGSPLATASTKIVRGACL